MKITRKPRLPFMLAVATLVAASALPAAGSVRRSTTPVGGSYIVVLRPGAVVAPEAGARAAAVRDLARDLASVHRGVSGRRFSSALDGFVFAGSAAAAAELASDPRVAFVEEDGRLELAESQIQPSWNLDRVDQHPAALDSLYVYNADGTGIDLYVIDTGILSSHEEFGNRVDVANGFTTVDDGYGTEDCFGHGTHVAGIAGGSTYGVAKNVTLHPVRVLNCQGQGQVSDLIAAIDWITARYPAPKGKKEKPPTRAVANISLSAPWTYALDYAVDSSVAAGVTYVVAAGNGGTDACAFSPARAQNAIKVGASNGADARASWSNYGPCVDLFAPGTSVTSSYIRSSTDAIPMSGTSMSAPHVAGTAALMLSIHPDARPQDVKATILVAATAGQLADVGTGSPNRLLFSAFAGGDVDFPPMPTFRYVCRGQDCDFDATQAADDWGIVDYTWDFGDGRTGHNMTPSHKYNRNAGGLFQVTLTVTDTIGQTSTIQQEVRTAW